MTGELERYSRYFNYIRPVARLPIVKTYGSTIFTLLIMIVFILFAIKPTVETIIVLQKKLADSNQILEKVNQKANNLSQAKENYENLDAGLKSQIQDSIPDTADLKSVIQNLEQIAIKNEASVSALQVQPLILEAKKENIVGNLSEVDFTFNVEGRYNNLITLLQDINDSARLISIESLSFNKSNEGQSLIMSISGKAYYLK